MKRICLIIWFAAALFAAPAHARELSGEALAELIYPMICECDPSGTEIAGASAAVAAAVSVGAVPLSDAGVFESDRSVSEFEFISSLVRVWEMRFGGIESAAVAGDIAGYNSYDDGVRKILDKAELLGIVEDPSAFSPQSPQDDESAEKIFEKFTEASATLRRYGLAEDAAGFMDGKEITGTTKAGRLYFYQCYNSPREFDNAVLCVALYDKKTLKSVSSKSYSGLSERKFSLLHTEIFVPYDDGEYSVKAFITDGFGTMRPICEYRLIR